MDHGITVLEIEKIVIYRCLQSVRVAIKINIILQKLYVEHNQHDSKLSLRNLVFTFLVSLCISTMEVGGSANDLFCQKLVSQMTYMSDNVVKVLEVSKEMIS